MVMKRLIRPSFAAYESVAKIVRRARWPLTIGVRTIVEDEARRVLLVRHTYTAGWHFPGGGVNKRETALDAAVREVREEAQIELLEAPSLVGIYLNLAQVNATTFSSTALRAGSASTRSRQTWKSPRHVFSRAISCRLTSAAARCAASPNSTAARRRAACGDPRFPFPRKGGKGNRTIDN